MPKLPQPLQSYLEKLLEDQLRDGRGQLFNFAEPLGSEALLDKDSVSWKVFSNPVSLLIGGIAAVILELAEPRVRTGVWEHTAFRTEPLARMRRTGLAAMITVYAPRESAKAMIAGIRKRHEPIRGTTPEGLPYHANDPELLMRVHATACYGFLEAYHRYVSPLSQVERDQFYREGAPIATLYGATQSPTSEAELQQVFHRFTPHLRDSSILQEFLQIMERIELFPGPSTWMNSTYVNAAIELLPLPLQQQLQLEHRTVSRWHQAFLKASARMLQRLNLRTSPYYQSRQRLEEH